ncbi:MAG: cytidylate kinase-like family protein [Myxococcales bacterium]|nr:cytidylate kinase-like family protein [Myxococcales bacterium]
MRNLEKIVETQIRLWSSRAAAESERAPKRRDFWPNITISREFGSRGAALGRLLAERIGFSFWDKELVSAIADESGANRAIIESLDETRRNAIEDAVQGVLMGTRHTTEDYVFNLVRLIRTIGEHGRAVIVGRGGHYVLPPADALRVRFVQLFDDRAGAYAAREGLDERKARAYVDQQEKERSSFVKKVFRRELANPLDYDIVLNLSTIGERSAIELVTRAYELRFARVLPH